MSTVTKIKGTVVNDALPVLTSRGLMSQYIGKYVAKMEHLGYEISEDEMTALNNFLDTITINDVLPYVKTFYPFIASSSVKSAINIPLIGSTELTFSPGSSSIVVDGSTVKGVTLIDTMPSIKMSDVMGADFIGVGISYKGDITVDTSRRIVEFENNGDWYTYRYYNDKFNASSYTDNGSTTISNQAFNYSVEHPFNDIITVHGVNNTGGRYVRTIYTDGTMRSSTSGSDGHDGTYYNADATLFASSGTLSSGGYYTSLMFLESIMPSSKSKIWCEALRDLLTALGKRANE